LEAGALEYETAEKFLIDLRKKMVKAAELQRIEQGRKIIEEFV